VSLTIVQKQLTNDNRPPGGLQIREVDITFDSSYPTGGEAITAANVGLHTLLGLIQVAVTGSTYNFFFDSTNSKIVGWIINAEITNTTDISAITAKFLAIGY
jgi:hypothetical protein